MRVPMGNGNVLEFPDFMHDKNCDCDPFHGKSCRQCRKLTRKMTRIFTNPANRESLTDYFFAKAREQGKTKHLH